MIKKWIPFIFLFNTAGLLAQNVSDLPANSFPFNMSGNTVKAFDNRYEGVKGTYTFMDKFGRGNILLRTTLYNGVILNYDAVNDIALVKKDTVSEAFSLRKDMVENFTLINNGESFHFVKAHLNGTPTYMIQLTNQKLKVYCKTTKVLKRSELGGAYSSNDKNFDEFVTDNKFYLLNDSGFSEIQKTKNGIAKAFGEHKDEVSRLLKSKRVDFNNLPLMTKLFAEIELLY
ncbi:MAG: hypothetical protein KIT62_00060 [Cyclobacteriaceae bacterium]|nr:hypothetical protein [Cyclobacteriaceae bacterium]